MQEIWLYLFILDNRKCGEFYLRDDNDKSWMEVTIVTFLDTVVTVDILIASNNDVKLVKTQTVHLARLL